MRSSVRIKSIFMPNFVSQLASPVEFLNGPQQVGTIRSIYARFLREKAGVARCNRLFAGPVIIMPGQNKTLLVFACLTFVGLSMACTKPEPKKRAVGLPNNNGGDPLDEIPKPCSSYPSLSKIQVQKDHNDPNSPKIDWTYQLFKQGDSVATLILIPGGPGGNEISDQESFDAAKEQYPDNFDIIRIDPRFVGCNYLEATVDDLNVMTTSQHAADIVSMIKGLGLNDFIIQGNSYGTVVATELVAKLEAENILPKAVILEGTVGRAFTDGVRQEFDVAWNSITESDKSLRKYLQDPPDTLDLTAEQMQSFIFGLASYSGRFLREQLELIKKYEAEDFASTEAKSFVQFVRNVAIGTSEQKDFKGSLQFYYAVACRELFEMDNSDVYSVQADGTLEYSTEPTEDVCAKLGLTMNNPFDAAEHTVALTPIYYSQGSLDPNTPLAGARDHYSKMSEAQKKYFVTVSDGGHAPLQVTEELLPCAKDIYLNALRSEDLDALVDNTGSCVGSTSLLKTDPTQRYNRALEQDIIDHSSSLRHRKPRIR
jgi:pimeloyl-ACP methyl ester carboxylesterase